ncbi:MAG: 2,5-diamino-6-(ribosylamino)-4(3H)-pyrimidinone 5'-phosphate reductase [Candidatus Thermoplasmatota archaeon]
MRPYVIINCAASLDGKIALKTRVQTRISSPADMRRVQRLRAGCDAVMVGVGTVLSDNPTLLVKPEFVMGKKQPLRVVLDSRCRTPLGAEVLDGRAETIIFAARGHGRSLHGGEVIEAGERQVDLGEALDILARRGVRRLLVEGGGEVIWSFLSTGQWDELKVFVGSMVIGGGGPTLAEGEGAASMSKAVRLRMTRATVLEDGILLEYVPHV